MAHLLNPFTRRTMATRLTRHRRLGTVQSLRKTQSQGTPPNPRWTSEQIGMPFTPLSHMFCQHINCPFMPNQTPIHAVILA
jgi:hypothetical protein